MRESVKGPQRPAIRRGISRGLAYLPGKRVLFAIGLQALAAGAIAGTEPENAPSVPYRVETIAEGLEYPWDIAFLPDGGMLISERVGRLRLINAEGQLLEAPISGLPEMFLKSQAGLLGLALAPDFSESHRLFFSYVCGTEAANSVCLGTGRLQGLVLEGVEVLFQAQPTQPGDRQYGGRLALLPDQTLALTLGDLYEFREQAQGLGSHLGKIVRLNLDGTAPADNPFVGVENALPEIFSLGHRNPLGIVYDQENKRLISHENGALGGDELNLIEAGANYGWPIVTYGLEYSGDRSTPYTSLPAFVDPLLHWTPSIAPSGMTIYRGDLFPAWQGDLLISTLVGASVHRVRIGPNGAEDVERLFEELNARIRQVSTGPDGAIYLLTDSDQGEVLRVVPEQSLTRSAS